MTPPYAISDDPQTAVILERIDSLRGDFQKLETKLETQSNSYVAMSVFVAWQTAYDREMRDVKAAAQKHEELISAQFAALRADLARPSQAPIYVGMVVAILTAAIALIKGLVGA